MFEITLSNVCLSLKVLLVGSQGAIRRRLNRNCCLRLRPLVAVETQAVMESRRVGEGRETEARRGGDSWIRSPHAHISNPTQRQLKTQIASPLLPGKVDIFRAFGKNSMIHSSSAFVFSHHLSNQG